MAKLFVPLDVDFATDPKILAAGPLASYLYVCSLAYCKRTAEPGRDGVVDREHLRVLAIGLPGKPEKYAAQLVAAGLWAPHHDGWIIPSWLKRNPSAVKLDKKRAQQKAKSILGNHEQHHVAKRKPSLDCILCFPEHDDDDTPQGDLIRSLLRSLQGSRTPPNGEPNGEPLGEPLGEADFVPNRTGREQEQEQEPEENRKRTGTGREPEPEPEPEENSSSSSSKLTLVAPPPTEDEDEDDFETTVTAIADLRYRTERARTDRDPIARPSAWKQTAAHDARTEHGPRIRHWLTDGHTPTDIAIRIETGTWPERNEGFA